MYQEIISKLALNPKFSFSNIGIMKQTKAYKTAQLRKYKIFRTQNESGDKFTNFSKSNTNQHFDPIIFILSGVATLIFID